MGTDGIHEAWNWIVERWTASAEPSQTALYVAAGIILATLLVPQVWHLARNALTIVHEMGHVLAAVLVGRRVQGIRLHSDTSGLAVTRGKPRGPGVLFVALAGYPAPGIVGLVLVWAAAAGYSGASLVLLVVLLLAALLLVRNVWGVLVLLVSLAGSGLVLWSNESSLVTTVVIVLGLFLALGAPRAAWDLVRSHLRRGASHSDATLAAGAVGGPAVLWLTVFVLVTCGTAAATLWFVATTMWGVG
ncbi:M50 family metallopeptidase [Brevibacterium litoralis]|uniref:M50 family metallopeptidase n=1 Tax=Brevibacterium litoralis TaxID=3138935 RepID=UPI0032EC7B2C